MVQEAVVVHVRIRPLLGAERFRPRGAFRHADSVVAVPEAMSARAARPDELTARHGTRRAVSAAAGQPRRPQFEHRPLQRRAVTPTVRRVTAACALPAPGSRSGGCTAGVARDATGVAKGPASGAAQCFGFDLVLDGEDPQRDVYDQSVAPLVEAALDDGANGAVLCYGPTGSGKTHTLLGHRAAVHTVARAQGGEEVLGDEAGVLPRAVAMLLRVLHGQQRTLCGAAELEGLRLAALEVYMDGARDLLHPGRPLRLHDRGLVELFSQLAVTDVRCLADFHGAYRAACERRVTSPHELNPHSSRSHAVFLLELVHRPLGGGAHVRSCLALVDLAGSERVKASGVEGVRLQEAQAINRSLAALNSVVTALHRRRPHVPYRDACLTRVLRPCFEGGRLVVLVHVPPAAEQRQEALATLGFADRFKGIGIPVDEAAALFGGGPIARELSDNGYAAVGLESDTVALRRRAAELCADIRLAAVTTDFVPASLRLRDAVAWERAVLLGAFDGGDVALLMSPQQGRRDLQAQTDALVAAAVDRAAAPIRAEIALAEQRAAVAEAECDRLKEEAAAAARVEAARRGEVGQDLRRVMQRRSDLGAARVTALQQLLALDRGPREDPRPSHSSQGAVLVDESAEWEPSLSDTDGAATGLRALRELQESIAALLSAKGDLLTADTEPTPPLPVVVPPSVWGLYDTPHQLRECALDLAAAGVPTVLELCCAVPSPRWAWSATGGLGPAALATLASCRALRDGPGPFGIAAVPPTGTLCCFTPRGPAQSTISFGRPRGADCCAVVTGGWPFAASEWDLHRLAVLRQGRGSAECRIAVFRFFTLPDKEAFLLALLAKPPAACDVPVISSAHGWRRPPPALPRSRASTPPATVRGPPVPVHLRPSPRSGGPTPRSGSPMMSSGRAVPFGRPQHVVALAAGGDAWSRCVAAACRGQCGLLTALGTDFAVLRMFLVVDGPTLQSTAVDAATLASVWPSVQRRLAAYLSSAGGGSGVEARGELEAVGATRIPGHIRALFL